MSRFKKLVRKIEANGESAHEANAVAAIAGRKKYGKAGMAKMAAEGKCSLELEGETGMLQNYSDEDVVAIMQQLIAEAILEGRLDNVDDGEIEQAQEIGLSLGFVEQDANGGLALASVSHPTMMGRAKGDGSVIHGRNVMNEAGIPLGGNARRMAASGNHAAVQAKASAVAGRMREIGQQAVLRNKRVAQVGAGRSMQRAFATRKNLTGAVGKFIAPAVNLIKRHPIASVAAGAVGGAVALRGAQKRYPNNG